MFSPQKLLGLFLLLGGALAYARFFRSAVSGVTGSRHHRITRETAPWRFRLTVASQFLGAAICIIAGTLCLIHFSFLRH